MTPRRGFYRGIRAVKGVQERFLPGIDVHPIYGAPIELRLPLVEEMIKVAPYTRGGERTKTGAPELQIQFPLTLSMASRTASPSRRRGGNRHRS